MGAAVSPSLVLACWGFPSFGLHFDPYHLSHLEPSPLLTASPGGTRSALEIRRVPVSKSSSIVLCAVPGGRAQPEAGCRSSALTTLLHPKYRPARSPRASPFRLTNSAAKPAVDSLRLRVVGVSGYGYEWVELVCCCGSRARDWQALQRRSPSHVASFVRSRLHFGFLALRPFGLPACWESRELLWWYSCMSVQLVGGVM